MGLQIQLHAKVPGVCVAYTSAVAVSVSLLMQNEATALHVASGAGHLEVVKFLVQECESVDVNATKTVQHTHAPRLKC